MHSISDIIPNGPAFPLIEEGISHAELSDSLLKNDVEGAIRLIENMKDLNAVNSDGFSPLHIACSCGNKEIIEFLISRKADVNLKNEKASAPLFYALFGKFSLCKANAIFKVLSNNGASTLFSIEEVNWILLNLCISKLSTIINNNKCEDCKNGYNELISSMVINHPTIDYNSCPEILDGYSLLNFLLITNFHEMPFIIKLVTAYSKYADLSVKDKKGLCALEIIGISKDKDFFNSLNLPKVEPLADPTNIMNGFSVLNQFLTALPQIEKANIMLSFCFHFAEYINDEPIKKWLYQICVENEQLIIPRLPNKSTLFHCAVVYNDLKGLMRLLESGLDPNTVNSDGDTPLLIAIVGNRREAIHILLESNKVDLSFKHFSNGLGYLPVALFHSNEEICDLLLKYGADIEALDNSNRSPLTFTLSYSGFPVEESRQRASFLLERGANGNNFDVFKNSPLYFCIVHNHLNLFIQILKKKSINGFKKYVALEIFDACILLDRVDFYLKLFTILPLGKSPLFYIKPIDENIPFLSKLFASGVDINESLGDDDQFRNYLAYAIKANSSTNFLNFLIDNGALINGYIGSASLYDAINNNNLEMFEWIYQKIELAENETFKSKWYAGLRPNVTYSTTDKPDVVITSLLHQAVSNRAYGITKIIFIDGRDFILKDKNQETPLDIAKRLNDRKMVNIVIENAKIGKKLNSLKEKIQLPLLAFYGKRRYPKKIMLRSTSANSFNIEITLFSDFSFERTCLALKKLNVQFESSQDKKKRRVITFDPIPFLSKPSLLLDEVESHFKRERPPEPKAMHIPPHAAKIEATAPVEKKVLHAETLPPKKKQPRPVAERPDSSYLDEIKKKQEEEKAALEDDIKPTRRRKENLPNPFFTHKPWEELIKADMPQVPTNQSAKPKPLPKQISRVSSKQFSQLPSGIRAIKKDPARMSPRAQNTAPTRTPPPITFQDHFPLTGFSNYIKSAIDSLTSIEDIANRCKDKENYDLENNETERNLAIHALEYRLLRFTQALTATGYRLTKEERKIFNKKIAQIVNINAIIEIRNQLRHAECQDYLELLTLAETIKNSKLSNHLNALHVSGIPSKEPKVVLKETSLRKIKWEAKFSAATDEKEKEWSGNRTAAIKQYILGQFDFIEQLSKPISENFHTFIHGGDRLDAMKMCLVKMGQCINLLNASETPIKDFSMEVIAAGNVISHEIEDEVVPYLTDGDVPDSFLYGVIKKLAVYKKLLQN